MIGIECATVLKVLTETAELRQSAKGVSWTSVTGVVGTGDDQQFVRMTLFAANAERLVPMLKRGSRLYVEGKVAINRYTPSGGGEERIGFAITAWRAELVGLIGKSRPRKAKSPAPNGQPVPDGAHDWQRPADGGDDAIPFGSVSV